MAANLSLVMDDTDKVRISTTTRSAQGLDDPAARRQRVELPLRAGRREADPLRPGRRQGHRVRGDRGDRRRAHDGRRPFRDLFDFCRRVDKRIVNRRAIEALIRAGAFDAIEPRRARAARLGRHRARRGRARRGPRRAGLAVRRGSRRDASPGLVAARDWTDAERLQHEKAALGYLPLGPSVRRVRDGAGAPRAHHARELAAAPRARARRRHRHADARPGEPPRQDGVRHARRWPRLRRDHGLQRDLRRRAHAACARTSSSSPR